MNAVMALHGKTGVNIFILITGFFAGGKVRSEKIIALLGLTVFYSLSLTGIAYLVDTVALSKKMLLKAALPFLLGNNYWFVITYLELYVLSPLMNRVIESIPRKTYQCYLLCFTTLLSFFPTVAGRFIETNDFGYNSLTWFVYLYFLGAYLAKYGLPLKDSTCMCLWMGLMAFQIAA